jgi:DNA-binding MarR family transcriptional regulator
MDDRVATMQRILDCSGSLLHQFNPSRDRAWLDVDLTMPQMKALICVCKNNGATSGEIARNLGVGLSTITGVVDRLAEQNLVTRREDPVDRRITRVLPTERGNRLVDDLLRYRTEIIRDILAQLDEEQLRVVEQAFGYLIHALEELAQRPARQEVQA